jgi:transcriptional regulator PpsR
MEAQGTPSAENQTETPKKGLGGLDLQTAMLISAAADVTLIIDRDGVIRDVACGSDELLAEGYGKWVGQPWSETVTVDSRVKIDALLADAASKAVRKWRQVNHPSSRGTDVPVRYLAIQIGNDGQIVAFGRDLRDTAAMQQRLVDAQQSMERDYWRLRHVETRYRLLFQMASEAILVVDASTQKVVEANPAAEKILGESVKRLVGSAFPDGFDAECIPAIQMLLASVQAVGRADDIRARMLDSQREFLVSASLFRQENTALFLVRLSSMHPDLSMAAVPKTILKVVENAPDGFVVTDPQGRILMANSAFVELVQLVTEEQVRGQMLDQWLGRSGVDFNVMIANLRQHGSVRLFSTVLRGEHGASAEVEISAVSVPQGEIPCLGFTIRNVGQRLPGNVRQGVPLPRTVEQLTELVGRVGLKEIVGETTDLIERLCIEAALELTHDNRASAAELLGLSRQSLYVKLRRYGLGDLAPEGDN